MARDNIEKLDTPDHSAMKSSSSGKKKTKVKGRNRIAKWFREMRSELRKVVWPTPKQTVNNTFVALTVMTAAAILIWALDYASGQIFNAIVTYVPRLFRGV
jgi:preprotein translocase subunit SecE